MCARHKIRQSFSRNEVQQYLNLLEDTIIPLRTQYSTQCRSDFCKFLFTKLGWRRFQLQTAEKG